MSRIQLFFMGLMLGMTAAGWCWGMNTIDSNLQRQIAFEERLQVTNKQARSGSGLASDKEGNFLAPGVYSSGTRPEPKKQPDAVSRQTEPLPQFPAPLAYGW